VIDTNRYVMAAHFFRLLKILMSEKWENMKDVDPKVPIDKSKLDTELRLLVLMALVWSYGAELDTEQRQTMTGVVNDIVRSKANVDEKYKLMIEEDWVFDDKICSKMASLDD
jgi:aminoglycoside/choline kinase family phosphotransferase